MRRLMHCLPILGLLALGFTNTPTAEGAEIVKVQKIWDQGNHNAFTDLTRFQDQWFCVFREGDGHVSKTGSLRVLKSSDGETWESAALITSDNADLRDAKISVTPEGKLCLAGAGAMHQPTDFTHLSYIWYSEDGTKWSDPVVIGDPNFWIWRITWHEGAAYGVGYSTSSARAARLYKSEDGKTFKQVGSDFAIDGYMNETGLLFLEDGTAMCVIRRDGSPNDALIGTAAPPFTDWTWKSLGIYIGGPELIKLEDGRFVVGGRKSTGGDPKTQLWELDPEKAELTDLVTLPSGGDTSYPGLVYHDDQLWVSYYSSHEGKSNIYLARVKLPAKE